MTNETSRKNTGFILEPWHVCFWIAAMGYRNPAEEVRVQSQILHNTSACLVCRPEGPAKDRPSFSAKTRQG